MLQSPDAGPVNRLLGGGRLLVLSPVGGTMPAQLVCIMCKDRIARDEPHIFDMYARAWCETCVIEYLGQYEPVKPIRHTKKR